MKMGRKGRDPFDTRKNKAFVPLVIRKTRDDAQLTLFPMQYQDFTLRGHDTRKGCDVNLVGDKHNRSGQIS